MERSGGALLARVRLSAVLRKFLPWTPTRLFSFLHPFPSFALFLPLHLPSPGISFLATRSENISQEVTVHTNAQPT